MANGLTELETDREFCQQLMLWEDPGFRQEGLDWLSAIDEFGDLLHPCAEMGGPGGPGGGRRRGH